MIASDSLTIEIENQYINLLIVFAKLNTQDKVWKAPTIEKLSNIKIKGVFERME
jgi:hypothetical protein